MAISSTSKYHFVSELPSGSPEIPKVGNPATLGPTTLFIDLGWRWNLKQRCRPHWELSNGMSHITCTQGNRGDQIVMLTFGPFFGHNLCFKCPNGSCEPILNIYVLIAFQWYKELCNPLGFDPCNCSLRIWKSNGTPNSQSGSSLRNVRVHSLTFSYTPGSMRCDSWASFGPHLCKPLP
jgi:hypothetical protein